MLFKRSREEWKEELIELEYHRIYWEHVSPRRVVKCSFTFDFRRALGSYWSHSSFIKSPVFGQSFTQEKSLYLLKIYVFYRFVTCLLAWIKKKMTYSTFCGSGSHILSGRFKGALSNLSSSFSITSVMVLHKSNGCSVSQACLHATRVRCKGYRHGKGRTSCDITTKVLVKWGLVRLSLYLQW